MSTEQERTDRLEVVGAAIVEGRTVLATQRNSSAVREALKWEFPGGKVETAETPRVALAREIREELNLEIEVGLWLGRGVHSDGGLTIELDVYVARITAGEIRLTEHLRYGWFDVDAIHTLDWATADRPILPALERFLRGRQKE